MSTHGNREKRILGILQALLLFGRSILGSSCRFSEELFHMDPPHVLSCHPAAEFTQAKHVGSIQLSFSAPMNSATTEEAFSVKTGSTTIPGTFRWDDSGKTLVFTPLSPLQDRKSYSITLSTAAEDQWGNSLKREFRHSFHTKEEKNAPTIRSTMPASGSTVTDSLSPIRVVFTEPMDRDSLLASFSLSPSLSGAFSFPGGGDTLQWTPLEPFRPGETYQVTLSTSATDHWGNPLTEEYRFSFQTSKTEQAVLSVTSERTGKVLTSPPAGSYVGPNQGIEKDDSFRIKFQTPVEGRRRDQAIGIQPFASYQTDWNAAGDEVLLSFKEPLAWNTVYELRVLDAVYRFRIDGRGSVPPEVRRVLYYPDLSLPNPSPVELRFAQNHTFVPSSQAAFDVYVALGPEASLVTSAFLSAFSLEAGNGCLETRLLWVEENPSNPAPPSYLPPRAGEVELKEQVIRVHCRINPLPISGTLTLQLDTDLRDTLGNRVPRTYTLTVNKE